MLDENLPTFVVKPSSDKPKQKSTFLYSQYGSEFEPIYSLQHPDPESPASKNRYAAGLYDAFNPEVLFAEVLLIPEWTHPTLSAEAVRLNGGVPPPPEPIVPAEFTIQLYNPDQQVVVRQKPGSWGAAPSWEFEIPQQTFRQPSVSTLDRAQHDPAGSEITPKIAFKWKKDSKLSKDLACFLSGKTTNPDGSKRKNKEPDITVAIFKHLKEVTLYEPNLQRVEIEDMKGFEVVLLLGAVVIRDVYFGHMKETFNITDHPTSPRPALENATVANGTHPAGPSNPQRYYANSTIPVLPSRDPRVPPTDPRTQWEIDTETARLMKQAEVEERERKRKVEAEQRQIKKMLESEEKAKMRRQAEIDAETERLKRQYGQQEQIRPTLPARHRYEHRHSAPQVPLQYQQPPPPQNYYQQPWGPPILQGPGPGPYLNVSGAYPQQSGYINNAQSDDGHRIKPKRSFFGFIREEITFNGIFHLREIHRLTGGSGKADRHVLPYLAAQGHQVLNLDLVDFPSTHFQPGKSIYTLKDSLSDSGQAFNTLTSFVFMDKYALLRHPGPPDAVIHFAADARNMLVPDNECFHANVMSTLNAVEAACKLDVKKLSSYLAR